MSTTDCVRRSGRPDRTDPWAGGIQAESRDARWCVNPSHPLILHCFPAHRTEVRDFHREQIESFARKIAASFRGARPIRKVHLVGHAATWRGISKAEYFRRGLVRAQNVRHLLRDELIRKSLGGMVSISVESRADDDPLVGIDNSTQKNRALNRRVEIRYERTRPKPKSKKKTCKSPEIVGLLRRAQVSSLTNIPHERRQLICLRAFLADVLSGKDGDDRFWTFTVVGGGTHGSGHAVKRDKTIRRAAEVYCRALAGKKLTPINISRALWKTHNAMLDGMEKLDRYFSGVPRGNPFTGDPVVEHTECEFARQILSRASSRTSVYKCYRSFVKVRFKRCVRDR